MKTKSHLWKLLGWITLTFAIFSYHSGAVISSMIIGTLAIVLFVIDFKFQVLDDSADKPNTAEAFFQFELDHGRGLRKIRLIVLGLLVLWGSQVIMNWLYSTHPDMKAPALCLICKK